MKTYHFELVLGAPTTDEEDERLFERFAGRVSSAVANGVPLLYLHLLDELREAARNGSVDGAHLVTGFHGGARRQSRAPRSLSTR